MRFCFFNTNKKRNILWSFLKWWQQNTQDLHIGNLSNLWTKVNKKVSDFRNWVVAQNTLYWYELLYQPLETFRNKIDQFVLFWRTYFEESRKYFKVYIHHIQRCFWIFQILQSNRISIWSKTQNYSCHSFRKTKVPWLQSDRVFIFNEFRNQFGLKIKHTLFCYGKFGWRIIGNGTSCL